MSEKHNEAECAGCIILCLFCALSFLLGGIVSAVVTYNLMR